MRKIILLLFLVNSCSNQTINTSFNDKINIHENLNFNQFKEKILNYAKNNNFPDIKN